MLGNSGRCRGWALLAGRRRAGEHHGCQAQPAALLGRPRGDLGGARLQPVVDDERARPGTDEGERSSEGERVGPAADRRGDRTVEVLQRPAYRHPHRSGLRRRPRHVPPPLPVIVQSVHTR